jgi:hypothetical protein
MHRVIFGTSSGGKMHLMRQEIRYIYDAAFLSNLTTSVMTKVQVNGT